MKRKKRLSGFLFTFTLLAILVATLILAFFIYRDQTATRSVADIKSYPLFWWIVASLALWVICLLWYTVMALRVRRVQKKRENDEKIVLQTLNVFSEVIDSKDEYAKGHSRRVSEYAVLIGQKLSLKEEELKSLRYAALMHDIGKVQVSSAVLTKPGELSEDERRAIEAHTTYGGALLEKYDAVPGMKESAFYHHERYDGKGYPKGLKGNKIPLFARIIAVADAYDAMNSDRIYRTRLPKERILSELRENLGKQFDPEAGQAMIDLIEDGTLDHRNEKNKA